MQAPFRFGDIVTGAELPANYMPAALPALRHGDAGDVVILANGTAKPGPAFRVLPQSLLRDPAALVAAMSDVPATADGLSGLRVPAVTAAAQCALVVIDYGIAFWNDRFADSDGVPRFRSVTHMAFDASSSSGLTAETLLQSELAAMCDQARLPSGERPLLRALANRFPKGFFGRSPDAQALWHGTAIADLAAGADPKDDCHTALLGIELPTASVADWSGDTLQAILPAALQAALAMTDPLSGLPLTIVLAFGYPGGPQDGTHPVAAAISRFLATSRTARDVTVVLPSGNHLQDRCTARLSAAAAHGPDTSVVWRLPPDDHSANTVQICIPDGAVPDILLTAPDGQTDRIALQPGQFAPVCIGSATVGGLHFASRTDRWSTLRLSLTGTGWLPDCPRPAPHGDWSLSVRADRDARLWILRDDLSRSDDRSRVTRPSVFFDPDYRETDRYGAYITDDSHTGTLRRSGTVSALATGSGPVVVGADERFGPYRPRSAFYSGRTLTGQPAARTELVDDGWQGKGAEAVGNGSPRRFRVSGTSSAAGMAAAGLCPRQTSAASS